VAFIVAPFKNYSRQIEHQDFGFMSVGQPNAIGALPSERPRVRAQNESKI